MLLSEEFETIIKVEKISKNDQNGFIFHGRDNQSTIFVTTEIHKSQQYKMNKELKERSRRESRVFSNKTNGTILKNNSRWNNLFEKKNRSLVSMQQVQSFHNISVEPFQRHRHRLSCRQSLEKNFAIKFKYVDGIIVREQGSPFGTNVMGVRSAHNQANIYVHIQSSSTEEDSEEEPLDFGFPTTDVEDEEVLIEKPKITQAFV
uniref:Uncharacterized protein n=1 Tax=Acrobeloides nanus TaxID=290746 RepID=A0A914CAZ2_9BILA